MSDTPHTFDATEAGFDTQVVTASFERPVLVDFWASWCGPCRALLPVVTKLAAEYGGKFLLAKVNIDEQAGLAQRYGVRSVPTVLLFMNGAPVDQFLGAQPEAMVRQFLDTHIPNAADHAVQDALALHANGDTAAALAALRALVTGEPERLPLRVHLLTLLLDSGDLAAAQAELDALPVRHAEDPAIRAVRARIETLRRAPDDAEAASLLKKLEAGSGTPAERYRLGFWHAARGAHEAALECFLTVLREDRRLDDDGARKAMLALFEQLGDDPCVPRYRAQMARLLY